MRDLIQKLLYYNIDYIKRIAFQIEKIGPNFAASIYIIIAGWFYTSMAIFNKLALGSINIAQIQIIRGIMTAIIS